MPAFLADIVARLKVETRSEDDRIKTIKTAVKNLELLNRFNSRLQAEQSAGSERTNGFKIVVIKEGVEISLSGETVLLREIALGESLRNMISEIVEDHYIKAVARIRELGGEQALVESAEPQQHIRRAIKLETSNTTTTD